jgi:hypothetical protein
VNEETLAWPGLARAAPQEKKTPTELQFYLFYTTKTRKNILTI